MYPLFRFTLNNSTKGSQVVDDPSGWEDIELILERDNDFHSIVELVETPLVFYSTAKEYILDVYENQGADSQVEVTIELSTDEGSTYTTIFEGVLSLEQLEEHHRGTQSHLVQVPILQNEFWQKFKNRIDTPVQIGGTTDLDGNTRETISSYTLNLPCQIIDKKLELERTVVRSSSIESPITDAAYESVYDLLGWKVLTDEVNYFSYPSQLTEFSIVDDRKYIFKTEEEGTIDVSGEIHCEYIIYPSTVGGSIGNYTIEWFVQVDDTQTSLGSASGAETDTGTYGEWVNFDIVFSETINAGVGSEVYLYGKIVADDLRGVDVNVYNTDLPLNATFTFHTTKADTTTEAWKIHETFHSATNLITGQNSSFYSDFLGNTSTSIRSYLTDGDGSFNALTGGINIRGKSLTEKPLYTSFKKLWEGANPLYNLGLGYEKDGSNNDIIRVEVKEHFYQRNPHTTLTNINNLVKKVDDSRYIKAVQVGFKKWKSEQIGGLDDPQTKHDYATRFKTFGDDVRLLSEFYAASLGIEMTRRKSLQDTEDWKLDDDIMIIALNRGGGSPSGLDYPELSEDFATTGLLNEATRYNVRLSPARMLLRWGSVLSAGLTKYLGAIFRFVGGEGNYDMRTQALSTDRGDYDGLVLDEFEDIPWDYDPPLNDEQKPIFVPVVYEFDYPISFAQYQNFKTYRKRSFYISESETDLKEVFLLKLEYSPAKGTASFECLKAFDPPATPSNVTATLNTTTEKYTVNWTDNSGNETMFIIEVNHNSTGFTQIGTVDADVTSFLDTTAYLEGDTIQYRVRGFNEDGYGVGSTSGVYTVAFAPNQPSSTNATLDNSTGQYTVTWVDESNNEDGFTIERNVDRAGWVSVGTTTADDVDITDSRVFSIGETVIYRVKATNTAGDSAWRESAELTVPPINAPTGAAASYSNSTWKYTVGWTDNAINNTGFKVLRSVNSSAFIEVADVPVTQWVDDVYHSIGDSIIYKVIAYNGMGESSESIAMEQIVPPITAPSGISVSFDPSTGVPTITWTDNSNNEQYFELQVNLNSTGFTTLDTQLTTTSYVDNAYTPGDTIQYQVRGTNPNGVSTWNVGAVETAPSVTPNADPTGISATYDSLNEWWELSWNDNATNESGYEIEISQDSINSFAPYGTHVTDGISTGVESAFIDRYELTATTYLVFRVRAYNSGGVSNWDTTGQVNVPY